MDCILETIVKDRLSHLVTFILEKHPNVEKDNINLKISELFFNGPVRHVKKITNKVKMNHNILTSLQEKKLTIKVKKNHYSNYILRLDDNDHQFNDLNKAKLVVVPSTKIVIGFENLNGQTEPLNKELIEICHRYKLRFNMPINLNIHDNNEDPVIADEMQGLGLNVADSEEDEEEE